MSRHTHGAECPNFPKLMAAYRSRSELRGALERERAETARLRSLLARVGVHDEEPPSGHQPPDTRARCAGLTNAGRCTEPALEDGWCAAHLADALGI
ncbi:hypothetical protein ACLESO_02805 [Pyxidicoccus sp. 3LG]